MVKEDSEAAPYMVNKTQNRYGLCKKVDAEI